MGITGPLRNFSTLCWSLTVLKSSSRLKEDDLMFVLDRAVREVSTCNTKYSEISGSTMCLEDSPDYITGTAGISLADKALILQKHNHYRSGVNPTAKAMPKLYWDDELANLAEKWAKQCFVGHEEHQGYTRFIPEYGMTPGQNGAFSYTSWEGTIEAWYNEVNDFTYGQETEDGKVVGHYTQIVQDSTVLIGCGYAKCSTSPIERFFFCNYLKSQTNIVTPYTNGSSCAGCNGSCDGTLCDCSGQFCFNGGIMDLETCQCTCPSPFIGNTCLERACGGKTCQNGGHLDIDSCTCSCSDLYTGDTCQTKTCPAADPPHCVTQWPVAFCDIYSNVPDICPKMCGQC